MTFAIEESAFGRVVVASDAPVFYTTADYEGRIDPEAFSRFIEHRFGIASRIVTCRQIHGNAVTTVTRSHAGSAEPTCDALVARERGVALGIKVADCLPVSIIGNGVIANIHSGWRGAVQDITGVTAEQTGTGAAYLGPSIRVCCFEVGEEVASQFAEEFVDRSRAKPHVDLVAFTTDILRRRGFAPGNIHDSGFCTRCDGSIFHSYRRDGKGGGRNLAIVAH